MANRLEPINLTDFTGGLNLRRNQFQLAPNESPEMVNVAIDPLGGIYTRRGWQRWSDDIVDPAVDDWDPRRAWLQQLSDGTDIINVVSDHKIYASSSGTSFAQLAGVEANATPHMADFANYGDDLYIACGRLENLVRRRGVTLPATLLPTAGVGTWNDDYLNPVHDVGPRAELIEAHSGYLFVANITEDDVTFPNRVRWSHPTSPDDWAREDFIDIETGGSHITGLISFEDHLLIFKRDSIWALYGYDQDSWQLVQKSATIGALSPQSTTRSEVACFFYSASDRGGIFAYDGERATEISEQLRYAMESLTAPELVWVGWIGRKLWVTLPWTYAGPTTDDEAVFVFDPTVGNGAWTYYSSPVATLGPIVSGSNVDSLARPMAVLRNPDAPCVVYLDALERAADSVYEAAVWGFIDTLNPDPELTSGYLVTDADEEIEFSGMSPDEPFETAYRTPWVTAGWPTRKKSFRRPDFVCRVTGLDHDLQVRSFRDYEEVQAKRQHRLTVPGGAGGSVETPGTVAAVWGHFDWNDGTTWGQAGELPTTGGLKRGASIRRGSSFGLCRSLQLRVTGLTPKAHWGVDAIILKIVMRRFR